MHIPVQGHISISQESKNTHDSLDQQPQAPQIYSRQHSIIKKHLVYITLIISLVILISIMYFTSTSVKFKSSISPHENHEIYVSQQFDHDRTCYTQGLSYINKTHLLQSCGIYGQSYFHILQYQNQQIKEVYRSPVFRDNLFIEGSVYFPKNGLYYFLTWREKIVIRFFEQNGKLIEKDRLIWDHPGWGLTHNTTHLIISQGTHKLYVTDQDLNIVRVIEVLDDDKVQVLRLNELEYVEENGIPYVYANIYLNPIIQKIDFNSGLEVEQYKLDSIVKREPQAIPLDEVINGIAFNEYTKDFLITGKRWKHFYLLEAF